jgi:hypothetical protein
MNLDIIRASIVGYHFGTFLTKPSFFYMINGLFWLISLIFKLLKKILFGIAGFIWIFRYKFDVKGTREDRDSLNETKGFKY